MKPISAVIITLNEEDNIGPCIDSLWQVADEIIVLDSFSSDNTVSIAKEKGAIVKQELFAGYIEQKNHALKLAKYDYVLSLDADEALSSKLILSILEAKKDFKFKAYYMNRYNHYCGRFINHGLWYPDQKVRLFDKRIAKWGGMNPHDKIELAKNEMPCFLKGDILHYTFNTIREHQERNERMSTIAAQSIFESDKKKHWSKIILSPAWSFINGYFFRLGFLDGHRGFILAIQTANLSFLKYQKLQSLQKQHKDLLMTITHNFKSVD
ncbi:MAG TPA: glycosyltransferase family 2 protein [Hanamia sp.]|nr:glycosyltransferase family 2 protein [Hanamia sp.]